MAQRKGGRAAQQGKMGKRRSARGRATAARSKAKKRSSTKVAVQKGSVKAKTKRAAVKLTKPKAAAPPKRPTEPPIEVVRVGQVREPAAGVVVVSEPESVPVGPGPATAVPGPSKKSAGIPESNGE